MIASLAAHVRKHAPSARSAKATASTSSTRICASIAEPALRPALSELPKRSNPKPTNITEQVPPRSCSVPYYAAKPLKRLQLRRSSGIAFQPRAEALPLFTGYRFSAARGEALPPFTGYRSSAARGRRYRCSPGIAFQPRAGRRCLLVHRRQLSCAAYRGIVRHCGIPYVAIFPGGVLH